MIVFGFSSLPAPQAGQFTWQRPHSTQVNASSTLLLPRSFTVSSPTCSFSKSRFGRLPSSGDFRNTVIGESTRCRCFDAGISAMNARITIMWIHQFTRAAMVPSSSRNASRNVIISVAMNSAMTSDSTDTLVPSATGRTNARRTKQIADAEQDGGRKRRQRQAVGMKPAGLRQVDDAEAVEELGQRVAAERDEAPEHERVHQAGERPLLDGPPLQQDVDDEAAGAEAEVVERKGVGSRGDQLNAARDLGRERAQERQEEDPEREGGHVVHTQRPRSAQRKPSSQRSLRSRRFHLSL